MTQWLLRRFVGSCEDKQTPEVRQRIGKLAGITGIVCNVLLFCGKLTVGLLSGAVSVVADGVNNLMDASSSVVTLLGFRMAQQPADEDHPYGHARYEYLSALAVAALILLVGVELAKSSVQKILQPDPVETGVVTMLVLAGSIGIKLWLSGFLRFLGRKIDSGALKAASADSRNDVIATAAVLVSCLCSVLFSVNLDGVAGLGVALFILYSGIQLGRETVSPLLGQRADRELVEKLEEKIRSYPLILGIHDLLVHDYGPGRCFASVHVEISAAEDPMESHHVIDHMEEDVLHEMRVHLVVHQDPVVLGDPEQEQMLQEIRRIVSEMDPDISVHDFRLIRGAKGNKLLFDLDVPFSTKLQPKQIRHRIDTVLREKELHYKTVIHFDGKYGSD